VKTLPLTVLMAFVVMATTSLFGADRKYEKTYQVPSGGTLVVNTDQGSVNVSGTGGSEVSILVELRGGQREVENFEITSEQTSSGVEVQGRRNKSAWSWLGGSNLDAQFTINVPREYHLKLRTSGGDVDVKNVKGRVEGKTSGGNVRTRATEGATELQTSGGDITAEDLKGDLHAQTSGGDVQIKKIVGGVEAGTSGGNVRVEDVEGSVKAETSGGNVSVSVRGTNKGVHAETSGGNVTIAIAKTVGATIDASTSGGEVECDLPVTVTGKIKSTSIRGTVNGGGNTIYAHTSGGNVRIRGLE
jgi:hypothetical protein